MTPLYSLISVFVSMWRKLQPVASMMPALSSVVAIDNVPEPVKVAPRSVIASEFALSVSSDWEIVTVYTPLNPMTASVDHASGTPWLQFDSWFQLPPAVLVQTSLPKNTSVPPKASGSSVKSAVE
jgi:hypothetical protein